MQTIIFSHLPFADARVKREKISRLYSMGISNLVQDDPGYEVGVLQMRSDEMRNENRNVACFGTTKDVHAIY